MCVWALGSPKSGDNFSLLPRLVAECEEMMYLNKANSVRGSGDSGVYNGAENLGVSEQERLGGESTMERAKLWEAVEGQINQGQGRTDECGEDRMEKER